MDLSVQNNIVGFDPSIEGSLLLDDGPKKINSSLCAETVLIIIVALGAIKVFGDILILVPTWLMIPGILIVAALLPTAYGDGRKHDGLTARLDTPSFSLRWLTGPAESSRIFTVCPWII